MYRETLSVRNVVDTEDGSLHILVKWHLNYDVGTFTLNVTSLLTLPVLSTALILLPR
jgi:hypothetical protein